MTKDSCKTTGGRWKERIALGMRWVDDLDGFEKGSQTSAPKLALCNFFVSLGGLYIFLLGVKTSQLYAIERWLWVSIMFLLFSLCIFKDNDTIVKGGIGQLI